MYIHIHIHIYIYTWAITPVTNLQPQFQGIQKKRPGFSPWLWSCTCPSHPEGSSDHLHSHLLWPAMRKWRSFQRRSSGVEKESWKMELEGNEKKTNNNSCPVCSDFEIFEVLLHLEILSDFTPRIRVAQPRPLALTQSATTPLTSAMVSSDMF